VCRGDPPDEESTDLAASLCSAGIDQLELNLSRAELQDVLRADAIASGTIAGQPTHVVGEVSLTADADDVNRATRRAARMVKAGLPAIPIVACEALSPETADLACRQWQTRLIETVVNDTPNAVISRLEPLVSWW